MVKNVLNYIHCHSKKICTVNILTAYKWSFLVLNYRFTRINTFLSYRRKVSQIIGYQILLRCERFSRGSPHSFQTVYLLINLLLDLAGKGEAFSGESIRMTRGVNGRPSIDPSLSGQRIRYSDSRMLFLFTYSSCSILLPDTLLGISQPY